VTARRPGFSLVELTVAMLIAGIIGVALARLIIYQSRFVALQDATMRARSGARAALNALSGELRAVTDGGLVDGVGTGPDSITVRVPYAFGVACQQPPFPSVIVVSLLPTDSAIFSASRASTSGYAWRDNTGTFRFKEPAVVSIRLPAVLCWPTSQPIATLSATGWYASTVAVSPPVVATPPGAIVYLYQTVRYSFKVSNEIPGRRALFRQVMPGGTLDELVAPFDGSARFEFLVGGAYTLQSTPPGVLDSVRGVRVKLVGASETAPEGRSQPVTFDLTTDILFRNNARQ
jgi:prepilin-type N-terminal cleavage/methylation domain-containing protein